jgi:hypothetical protein
MIERVGGAFLVCQGITADIESSSRIFHLGATACTGKKVTG